MKAIVFQQKDEMPQLVSNFECSNTAQDLTQNWVKVQVKQAAFNRRDYWITKGMYPGLKPGVVLGSDASGLLNDREVIVNPGLFWGNDERVQSDAFEVLGMPNHGSFCEELYVPRDNVFDKPPHLSMVEAAALPLAGLTAYRALFSRGACTQKSKILINGVGGGVAAMALQFSIAIGAEVFVTSSSSEKIEKAIQLGAKGGKNYKEADWSTEWLDNKLLFDVVIDSAGGQDFDRLIKLTAPGGRISVYGGTRGNIGQVNTALLFWRQISINGSTMGSPRDFQNMLNLVNKHQIKPLIDQVIEMDDFSDGFETLKNSSQFGKVVMNIR